VTNTVYSTFHGAANFISIFQGNNPWMVSSPHLTSFLIFNVPDNVSLNQTGLQGGSNDTDGDSVSDYNELYTYFTNPCDADTDHDGWSDSQERVLGSDPNNYQDPGLNNPFGFFA
jgi:hypothetical protein